jgi:two-component system, chemotaxis family, CheB/CheR fusion protein
MEVNASPLDIHLNDDSEMPGRPSHVVGIGASAGGLEALQVFFEKMKVDSGAAFVVIQHLSPDFKSVMDQLLARHTSMSIKVAADGEQLEPNAIYLNPPKQNMIVAEGRLLLSDVQPHQGLNLPIDTFFRSLAEDQQHRSVAIVLSGTGSDGSRGIQALKEAGGLVIVQDPRDAKFDGMPHAALNTGLADLVLGIEDIPSQLASYISHPLIRGNEKEFRLHLASNEDVLQNIFILLKRRSEIDFSEYKQSTVARRIERRLGLNNITSLSDYYDYLQTNPREISILAKELLIGVTRFFRDQDVFTFLTKNTIPSLVRARRNDEPLRVWIAGCSTGEEAYSIAMLLIETMDALGYSRPIKIFATDIDASAITAASAGVYAATSAQEIGEERLQRFFVKTGEEYTISQRVRQMVVFAVHNLIKDPPFSNMDLVTCRNTLIYLQKTAQRRALSVLHFALRPEGVLLLGQSESLAELQSYFTVIENRHKIFRKTHDTRIPIDLDNRERPSRHLHITPNVAPLLKQTRNNEVRQLSVLAGQALIEKFAPAAIVLNEQKELVHTYGDTGDYLRKLQPGRVSMRVQDLIEPCLSVAITTAINRAQEQKTSITYQDVLLDTATTKRTLTLHVWPIENKSAPENGFVIAFVPDHDIDSNADTSAAGIITFSERDHARQRIADLEQELQNHRESLQTTVEELETTNEELQSANEELMAANEELQSTNEELQSVNEELYTVNTEYQDKIQELVQINSDLDNLMRLTKLATVFLDKGLRVRRYTPAAAQFINLLPMDLDRPFSHISHQFTSDLNLKIQEVSITRAPQESELRTQSGLYIKMRILPYIGADGSVSGTVLIFDDVSEMRAAQLSLAETQAELTKTQGH